jgi:hypothetical protein
MNAFLFLPLLLATPAYTTHTVKDADPPKELSAALRKLLAPDCVQLLDDKGTPLVEIWFCKRVAIEATAAQIENGLTYAEVPVSTVLGAVRFGQAWHDYRKQKIAPGVYTLRIARQPGDGDHKGTAPTTDFCILCPAADDKKPDLMEAKALQDLSLTVGDNHPGVVLLFPGKDAGKVPKLVTKNKDHSVLLVEVPAQAGDKKATLRVGLTLVGGSASR